MRWLLWGLISFAPTGIIVSLALRALRRPSADNTYDFYDIRKVFSWITPALAVLAAQPLADMQLSGTETVLLCVLPLYMFHCADDCLLLAVNTRTNSGLRISAKDRLKSMISEQAPALSTSIVFAGWALCHKGSFSIAPSVSLYVTILAMTLMSSFVLHRFDPFRTDLERLAPCGLNSRVVEIAREHGVEIESVWVMKLPMARVNACVLSESYILISEDLVKRLNKEEVDAVVAHEAGHMADYALWWYTWPASVVFMLVFILIMLRAERAINTYAGLGFLHYVVWVLLFTVPHLAQMRWKRCYESKANRAAREYSNPLAVISGHYKLCMLNKSPLSRPWWLRIVETHPTFAEEAATISKNYGLSKEDLEEIYSKANEELESDTGNHYETVYYEQKQETGKHSARPAENEATSGKLGYVMIGLGLLSMALSYVAMLPLERYHSAIPPLTSLAFGTAVTAAFWYICERRRARRNQAAAKMITDELHDKYRDLTGDCVMLVDAIFTGDWDKRFWQGAYLCLGDDYLQTLGEFGEERISSDSITDVVSMVDSDRQPLVLVFYTVNDAKYWLGLRTFGLTPKGQPRSARQMTHFLREQLAVRGARLKDRRLTAQVLLARVKRMVAAAVFLAAVIALVCVVAKRIGISSLSAIWVFFFVIAGLITHLYLWIKQASTH